MITIHFPDTPAFKDKKPLPVEVDDQSYRYRSIMGKNEVTLNFSLPNYVHFPSGCWITYKEKEYYCLTEGSYKKNARHEYEYTVIFEPHAGKLRMWTLRNLDTQEFKFSATYTPTEAIQLIVDNLNTKDSGWSVGECIEAPHKTFDFNNTKLDVVLSMIASDFNTEFEIVGKTIHLKKVEYGKEDPLSLSYGRGNGFLPGVGVVSSGKQAQFEVLIIQGGNRNLDSSRYDNCPLWHLPKNARMEYKGITYQTDPKGQMVSVADKPLSTQVDLALDLSEMYPQRVLEVDRVEIIDKEKRLVDIICRSRSNGSDDQNYIPDSLDYSQYRIQGETATITFQTGMLSGRTFDIEQSSDRLSGYVHPERRFKLVPKTEDSVDLLSAPYLPEKGDTFAVFGVMLPNAYINSGEESKQGVEWDMFKEACRYFDEKNVIPFRFSGSIDPNWASRDWLNRGGMLEPGWFIRFSDLDFKPDGYDIRIVGMRDYANDPYKVSVELSNDIVTTSLSTDFAKIDGERQRLDREKSALKDYTSRSYADAIRTAKMLVDAGLDGFTEKIQPISIQTMQLLVGATECQFVFVDRETEPQTIVQRSQYLNGKKQFICDAGLLKHLTIGIEDISKSHDASEYRYWNMPLFTSTTLTEKKGYYVYAKCNKTTDDGMFMLSETAIKLEEVSGYYHFLVGILNPEIDGKRGYAPMYGFSSIEPGRMIVDRIQSTDFDMDAFTGTCFDLANRRLILGNNAEIITNSLKIRPPSGSEYDFVKRTTDNLKQANDNATTAMEQADDAYNKANALNYLKQAMQEDTTVNGGLVATTTVHLKSGGRVNSGIDGTTNPVGFFTGATGINSNGVPINPKTLLNKDGSGYLANGGVSWTSGGTVNIKGMLEVLAGGKIANFTVEDDRITGVLEDESIVLCSGRVPSTSDLSNNSIPKNVGYGNYTALERDTKDFWYPYIQGYSGISHTTHHVLDRFTLSDTVAKIEGSVFFDMQYFAGSNRFSYAEMHVRLYLKDANGNTVADLGDSVISIGRINASQTANRTINFQTYKSISAGTYTIEASVVRSVDTDGYNGEDTIEASFECNLKNIQTKAYMTLKTTYFGSDGLMCFYSPDNYMKFTRNDGFECRIKDGGWKTTSKSNQMWLNNGWKTITRGAGGALYAN